MRVVFNKKENRYVELDHEIINGEKIYNEAIIEYDENGLPILFKTDKELWDEKVEQEFAKKSYAQKRREICNSCEYKGSFNRCTQCNCIIPFKVLVKWATCPKGKW